MTRKEDVGRMDEMRKELPIVECAFGWGKVFRLYQHDLDVNGTRYALTDLTHVYPSYQRVLGISSIRLELHFGKKKVTIRGIAAIADAQKAIAYLKAQCSDASVSYTHKGGNVDTGWSKTGASGISGTTMPKTETQFELPTYH